MLLEENRTKSAQVSDGKETSGAADTWAERRGNVDWVPVTVEPGLLEVMYPTVDGAERGEEKLEPNLGKAETLK